MSDKLITLEARRKMGWRRGIVFTAYKKKCLNCGREMTTIPSQHATFCSRYCYFSYKKRMSKRLVRCKTCRKEITYYRSRNRVYCSQECKIKGLAKIRVKRTEGRRIAGKLNDAKAQKKWLLNNCKSCQMCGFSKSTEILEIHHKDRNRKNNHIKNLILLCPNCHALEHFESKDGQFANNLGKRGKICH